MNSMFITGNVVRTPVLRKVNTSKGEMSVIDVDIAVNKIKKGERAATYYRCTAWGPQADTLAKHTQKGMKLTLQTDSPEVQTYKKQDGTEGYQLVAQIKEFEFPAKAASSDAAPAAAPAPAANDGSDDLLPF